MASCSTIILAKKIHLL
ncbi:hypothetical protein ACGWY6_002509 [Enterococcus faecalis]